MILNISDQRNADIFLASTYNPNVQRLYTIINEDAVVNVDMDGNGVDVYLFDNMQELASIIRSELDTEFKIEGQSETGTRFIEEHGLLIQEDLSDCGDVEEEDEDEEWIEDEDEEEDKEEDESESDIPF